MKSYAEVTRPANLLRSPCCRKDKTWRRKGQRYRSGARPELTNAQTVAALGGLWKRKGRQAAKGWTLIDHTTLHEVEARSMGFFQIQDCRGWTRPIWLTREVAPRQHMPMITILLHAYRAGAIGVLCSYEEWCGLLECSRRTVARYQRDAEKAGLIRILPTCKENERADGSRNRSRNLIQLGPALIKRFGCGLLEGASGQKNEQQGHARTGKARKGRKVARAVRREHWGMSWQQHEEQRQRPQAKAELPSQAKPRGPKVPPTPRATTRPSKPDQGRNPSAPPASQPRASLQVSSKVAPHPLGPPLKGGPNGREGEPSVPEASPEKEIRTSPNPLNLATPPPEDDAKPSSDAPASEGGGVCPERAARSVPNEPPEAEPWADVVALGTDFLAKLRGDQAAEVRARRREESAMVRGLMDRDRQRERIDPGPGEDAARSGASVSAEGSAGAPSPAWFEDEDGAPWGAP